MQKQKGKHVILLHNDVNLEREGMGVYKVKRGSEVVGSFRITAKSITLSEICENVPYISVKGNVEFLNGEKRIVFDVGTLEVKELRTLQTTLTMIPEDDEITINDKLIKNGQEFFHSFPFNLIDYTRDVEKLLEQFPVKWDYEKIKDGVLVIGNVQLFKEPGEFMNLLYPIDGKVWKGRGVDEKGNTEEIMLAVLLNGDIQMESKITGQKSRFFDLKEDILAKCSMNFDSHGKLKKIYHYQAVLQYSEYVNPEEWEEKMKKILVSDLVREWREEELKKFKLSHRIKATVKELGLD